MALREGGGKGEGEEGGGREEWEGERRGGGRENRAFLPPSSFPLPLPSPPLPPPSRPAMQAIIIPFF